MVVFLLRISLNCCDFDNSFRGTGPLNTHSAPSDGSHSQRSPRLSSTQHCNILQTLFTAHKQFASPLASQVGPERRRPLLAAGLRRSGPRLQAQAAQLASGNQISLWSSSSSSLMLVAATKVFLLFTTTSSTIPYSTGAWYSSCGRVRA